MNGGVKGAISGFKFSGVNIQDRPIFSMSGLFDHRVKFNGQFLLNTGTKLGFPKNTTRLQMELLGRLKIISEYNIHLCFLAIFTKKSGGHSQRSHSQSIFLVETYQNLLRKFGVIHKIM